MTCILPFIRRLFFLYLTLTIICLFLWNRSYGRVHLHFLPNTHTVVCQKHTVLIEPFDVVIGREGQARVYGVEIFVLKSLWLSKSMCLEVMT